MGEAFALVAPGIEIFAGERSARLDFGDDVGGADDEGCSAVTARLLGLAFGGAEAAIGDGDGGAATGRSNGVGGLQNRGEAGANRAGGIGGANLSRELRGGTDEGGVELFG